MTRQERAFVGGLIGCLLGTTFEAHRIARKHDELAEKYNKLIDNHTELLTKANKLSYMLAYLAKMLDDNNIEFDEFDQIALNDPPGYFPTGEN